MDRCPVAFQWPVDPFEGLERVWLIVDVLHPDTTHSSNPRGFRCSLSLERAAILTRTGRLCRLCASLFKVFIGLY